METTNVFTFCKNDLQSTSFAAFEEMRRKGQFCDLTIKVQNHTITAHRIIVAAGIPYFQGAFECTDSEGEEKEIEVRDDLDPRALESLVLFAYTSKVDITTENVQSLLVTAQFLQLDEIRDSCTEFLSKRLNVYNVWHMRELANGLSNVRLTDSCNRHIRQNFEDFSKTLDFLNLSHSCVKEILLEDDLMISSEKVAFEAIIQWVKFSPSERQAALPELLTEVRMIYLPVPYLMKHVDTEDLVVNSKPCKDLVNEVKYYHLLPEMFTEFSKLKTRPRNCFMQNLYAVCSHKIPSSQRLFVFTFVNRKWLALSTMESSGTVHKVIVVDGNLYLFLDTTILIFAPGNHEWNQLGSSDEDIAGAAIALYDGKIYCFGSEYEHFADKMRFFDTQSNTWSQMNEMSVKRWEPAATSLGEFIYVTGGYNMESQISSVEKYCPSRNEWTHAEPMLTARDSHGCTSMNGKIYVCGGMTGGGNLVMDTAEVYDPLTDQWDEINSMQNARRVISLVPHAGKMYAFGKTDIEVYDPEKDEWEICSFVPIELRGAVSILT